MDSLKCFINKITKRPKHNSIAAKPKIKKVSEKHPASSIKTPKIAVSEYKEIQLISAAKSNWKRLAVLNKQLLNVKKKQAFMNDSHVNTR